MCGNCRWCGRSHHSCIASRVFSAVCGRPSGVEIAGIRAAENLKWEQAGAMNHRSDLDLTPIIFEGRAICGGCWVKNKTDEYTFGAD